MQEDRIIFKSSEGFKADINTINGRGFHWVTTVHEEIPVKLTPSGPGSERPQTISAMFINQVKSGGSRNAMFVDRAGKILVWTWDQYFKDSMSFAKSLLKLKVNERSAVAIMGYNSPEWAIGFVGGILHNCVVTGIYSTNAEDACMYQVEHSEAEVILVENNEYLARFNLEKLPRIKAVVIWGESNLASNVKDSRVLLWKDFIKLGQDIKDEIVYEKVSRQKPGECSTLIYTSGTTGMPKGCMLSHDNLCWESIPLMEGISFSDPTYPVTAHRVVSYLPLSHIAGLTADIMSHIYNGHELYFARPDALQGTLVQTLTWARPTLFLAVPRIWEKFEDKLKEIGASKPAFMQRISAWAKAHGAEKVKRQQQNLQASFMFGVANSLILSKIKQALGLDQTQVFAFGAAALKQSTIDYFASLDMPLFNCYGMSETTGSTTSHTALNFRLDTAGPAMPGTELKISNADEHGEGEILMRGRNTMMGYLKNEQATIETIDSQGFIKSGDRGKIEKDGHLKITGRIKELIIGAGGENIAPVPIEDNFKAICPPCSNIMLVGEMQRFMACLITFKVDVDLKTGLPSQNLIAEVVTFFKKELGIDVKTSIEACQDPKILDYIGKCVEATNKKSVSRAAHIRKFKLIPIDFSIPGGELTPTMKLKRKVTEKKYAQFIEQMFAPDAKL